MRETICTNIWACKFKVYNAKRSCVNNVIDVFKMHALHECNMLSAPRRAFGESSLFKAPVPNFDNDTMQFIFKFLITSELIVNYK